MCTLSEAVPSLLVGNHKVECLSPFTQVGDVPIITLTHCPPVEKRKLEFEEDTLTEALHVIDIFIHSFFRIVILNEGKDKKEVIVSLFENVEHEYRQ